MRCVYFRINSRAYLVPTTGVSTVSTMAPQPADSARLVKIIRDAGYQGWVTLEYEAAEEPYDAIPKHVEALRKVVRDARG